MCLQAQALYIQSVLHVVFCVLLPTPDTLDFCVRCCIDLVEGFLLLVTGQEGVCPRQDTGERGVDLAAAAAGGPLLCVW